jgi:hypothetical protein
MAKFDWSRAKWENTQRYKPLETPGQKKERRADTKAFVARISAGKPARNRYAKNSGPVKIYSPEEIAAFEASRRRPE